jgi:putative PIN family toxin of toxin-antitoxin system
VRVTLDTNVLIAAFIAKGTCHEVLEDIVRHHELALSEYILDELTAKLTTKFGFSRKEAREAKALLLERAELVEPVPVEAPEGVDEDDRPILGTAASARSHCLVTGDGALLALGAINEIRILKPGDFWRMEDDSSRGKT